MHPVDSFDRRTQPPVHSHPNYQAPSAPSASRTPSYDSHPASGHPVPPARRSATFPSMPGMSRQPVIEDPALAAHHRSLVAYYWHYAQQGYAAPLTAARDTEEYLMQERARREAVEWARQCGMNVQEVEPRPSEGPVRARTASRPLPVAPSATSGTPAVVSSPSSRPGSIAGGRPLPPAPIPPTARSVSAENPTDPALPPPHRSFSETQSHSQAFPSPSPNPVACLPNPPVPLEKRPLPQPPPGASSSSATTDAVLAGQVAKMTVLDHGPSHMSTAPTPAIPMISIGNEEPAPPTVPPPRSSSPHPTPPAIPTFMFNDGDEPPSRGTSPAPDVPVFSFTCEGDDLVPPRTTQQREPPIHPRYDPSHPSHTLYHPTSVASPLDASATASPLAGSMAAEAGTIECTSCRQPIFGRVLLALSRTWHPACFVCAEEGCREKLEVMEFEGTPEDWVDDEAGEGDDDDGSRHLEGAGSSLKGKAWCMVHFEERFALKCYHCHTPISSADYLPINDPSLPPEPSSSSSSKKNRSTTRYYHPLHFFCAGCGDPFLDPVAYERSGEAIAMPYYVREQHAYCERCDLRMWRDKCPGCRLGVREEDGYVEIEDASRNDGNNKKKKWHEGCFTCSMCSKPLTGIYLLRAEEDSSGHESGTAASGSSSTSVVEKPYCGECFDRVAKDEAKASVA
ncbi:hypothetical protein JCM3766R1_005877 [Sporobolomyces carnicolor]